MRNQLLAALVATAAIASPALATPEVGKPAPAFSAVDIQGKTRQLSEFRGKTVVLEWNNPECPFVRKHYGSGNMQALQKQATKDGVVWLTINSGAPGKQGHLDPAGANAMLKQTGAAPTAYLLDSRGEVGRLYAATATPQMFVVNPAGQLVYMGAIDDTPTADPADVKTAKNYVLAALADLKANRPVATPQSRPYGCSVKY